MPAVTQKSTLAARLGEQITKAYQETKDKPVDSGFQRLPGGIQNGIAELRGAAVHPYTPAHKSYEAYKGEEYFRAFGVVLLPHEHAGIQTTYNLGLSPFIPLHATPANGQKPARSFFENFDEFQNFFKLFDVWPPGSAKGPPIPPQLADPRNPQNVNPAKGREFGVYLMDYYTTAANALTSQNPKQQFKFSTREWTPPQNAEQKKKGEKPTPMVFETWHGKVEHPITVDPSSNGVLDHTKPIDTTMAPEPFTEPPMGVVEEPAVDPQFDTTTAPNDVADPADAIQASVIIAEGDPNGETPDGTAAIKHLKDSAIAAGFTVEQVNNAASWADVGNMALGIAPDPTAASQPNPLAVPTAGTKHKYLRRDGKGNVLQNPKTKSPFPHIEVEVVTVNAADKTCQVKTADGKYVTGLGKGAGPVQVKWEWLE